MSEDCRLCGSGCEVDICPVCGRRRCEECRGTGRSGACYECMHEARVLMSDKAAVRRQQTPERVVERAEALVRTFVLRADLLRDAQHSAGAMQTGWRVTEVRLRDWTGIIGDLLKLVAKGDG